MKEDLKELSLALLSLYLVLNILPFIIGLFDGVMWGDTAGRGCDRPQTRIGLVFKGYALGCWLGRPYDE